jgi:hypothetical protein
MTLYDDPNREAVGLEPIWTGAEEVTRGRRPTAASTPASTPSPRSSSTSPKHPDEADAVLAPKRPARTAHAGG